MATAIVEVSSAKYKKTKQIPVDQDILHRNDQHRE